MCKTQKIHFLDRKNGEREREREREREKESKGHKNLSIAAKVLWISEPGSSSARSVFQNILPGNAVGSHKSAKPA